MTENAPEILHVPSGSYHVCHTRDRILVANLGTCVGLILYDSRKGVGGLYHILLPAPVSSDPAYEPENYAATGLPLFLDALLEAGAEKKNLVAVIAGDALVDPVSSLDFDLNIGGDVFRFLAVLNG